MAKRGKRSPKKMFARPITGPRAKAPSDRLKDLGVKVIEVEFGCNCDAGPAVVADLHVAGMVIKNAESAAGKKDTHLNKAGLENHIRCALAAERKTGAEIAAKDQQEKISEAVHDAIIGNLKKRLRSYVEGEKDWDSAVVLTSTETFALAAHLKV